jgi:hypothetical protein
MLHEEPSVKLLAAVATESALPLEPAKPAGSSANLGDNVELF